jgi:KipI family sensor histidine kinase inhibitor
VSVHPFGESAALVDTVDENESDRLASFLRTLDTVTEAVPALRSVLVVASGAEQLAAALARIGSGSVAPAREPRHHRIQVRYDGPDLAEVAELTGLAPDQVVTLHARPGYRVAFLGFAPGFGYLTGLHPRLRLPRLATPRTRVPAGSVAIAEEWAAVYPTESPGGWRLIGGTTAALFDPADALEPARLRPGDTVSFQPA